MRPSKIENFELGRQQCLEIDAAFANRTPSEDELNDLYARFVHAEPDVLNHLEILAQRAGYPPRVRVRPPRGIVSRWDPITKSIVTEVKE